MKITSPFIEHIPQCKRSMRRLRKKIYKFIMFKHQTYTKITPKKDILLTLKQRNVPSFLVDCLSRKKTVDLNSINNMILSMKVPLADIIQMTSKQEHQVYTSHQEWTQNTKVKYRFKNNTFLNDLRLKQQQSRKTISSTQFQYQEQDYEQELNSSVPKNNQRQFSQPQFEESAGEYIKFNHCVANNGYLDMEQSVLSHENLFRFQQ